MNQTEKQTGWIQTFSSIRFWPLDPSEDHLLIEDIAHSLSMQCRFNGHTNRFYSVAEHCCHVSDLLPGPLKLAGLLHDAAEAYLCDLPKPLKYLEAFVEYRKAEANLERLIANRFGFEYPLDSRIKNADEQLLATEAEQLMAPLHAEFEIGEPIKNLNLPCWSPTQAKDAFLWRYWNTNALKEGHKQ